MTSPVQPKNSKRVTRLWAVQALYQKELAGLAVESLIEEFVAHRLDAPSDGVALRPADADFFAAIVRGVTDAQSKIDNDLDAVLSGDWTVARLDSTLRAVLRCGAYELRYAEGGESRKAIIGHYTDIAHAFFDDAKEGGMANAVLDALLTQKQ